MLCYYYYQGYPLPNFHFPHFMYLRLANLVICLQLVVASECSHAGSWSQVNYVMGKWTNVDGSATQFYFYIKLNLDCLDLVTWGKLEES